MKAQRGASHLHRVTFFDCVIVLLLTLITLICIIPIVYVITASVAPAQDATASNFRLIPSYIDWTAYQYLISSETLFRSIGVSLFITVVGTAINMLLTVLTAFPLSRKSLPGRRFLNLMIVFTMLFNGGMIPTYLVVSGLGMLDTYWALWLPGAISAFNMIILRNSIQGLPEELIDAAKMDGCGEWRTLTTIVLPLTKASLATFTLFYAVAHWNSYFSAILYIKNNTMWPIQVWLRQIVMEAGGFGDTINDIGYIPPQSIQYAVIVFATLPILLVYPFVQKYFTKGILVGSVKG